MTFCFPPRSSDGARSPFVSGLGAVAFAHVTGFGAVPPVRLLESTGWVRVGAVPGLTGLYLMRRDTVEGRD